MHKCIKYVEIASPMDIQTSSDKIYMLTLPDIVHILVFRIHDKTLNLTRSCKPHSLYQMPFTMGWINNTPAAPKICSICFYSYKSITLVTQEHIFEKAGVLKFPNQSSKIMW